MDVHRLIALFFWLSSDLNQTSQFIILIDCIILSSEISADTLSVKKCIMWCPFAPNLRSLTFYAIDVYNHGLNFSTDQVIFTSRRLITMIDSIASR